MVDGIGWVGINNYGITRQFTIDSPCRYVVNSVGLAKIKRKKRAVLSDHDLNLLLFLWKWKVSTTAAIAVRYYPHKNLRRAYNRLLVLEKAGIIQSRADIRGERFVWTLTREGYRRIRHTLPEMKEEGFESKALGHDLLCSAVLWGDWIGLNAPDELVRVGEQQLSRLEKHLIPIPFDRTYEDHRADGYWHYKNVGKTIALEVQISRQKLKDYKEVGEYYHSQNHVETVLWVVDGIPLATAILKGVKSAYNDSSTKHNFVSFKNYLANGYEAAIEVGPLQGLTIHHLLCGNLKEAIALPKHQGAKKLLDVRKSPHIAKNERYFRPGDHW